MVDYGPEGTFDAIFVIYSHLGFSYCAFHAVVSKLIKALRPNGLLAIAQSVADDVPGDDPAWDRTRMYVEGYNLPFWDEPVATLMFTHGGQKVWLESMGLKWCMTMLGSFSRAHEECDPEHQQYVVGRRRVEADVSEPRPLP